MTNKKALEVLKSHNEKCSGCDKLCDDMCKPAVELAIQALEREIKMERPTAYFGCGMIKPMEILPMADEKVLVWIEYGTFSGFSIGSIIEDGRCLWDIECLNGFHNEDVVKAWWHLPEYKPQ